MLASLGVNLTVLRNNTPLTEIEAGAFDAFVIGPGPGKPADAGVSNALFSAYHTKSPILGICLGLQAMNDFFGGRTVRAKRPMHGKLSAVTHDGQGLFRDIPQEFSVMRYHSLVVEREILPSCLAITAETAEGEVMGLRHKDYPLEAVQFHPESHATEYGQKLFLNWLQLINPKSTPKKIKKFV